MFQQSKMTLNSRTAFKLILYLGILYRVVIFFFLDPSGNDRHDYVIVSYLATGSLPISDGGSAFHPPLYHLLASPWMAIGGEKLCQTFSLLLSIATLFLIADILRRNKLDLPQWILPLALGLPAFLPAFVLFSLLITNSNFFTCW